MKIVRALILADVENGMPQSSNESARGTRDSNPNEGGPDGNRTRLGGWPDPRVKSPMLYLISLPVGELSYGPADSIRCLGYFTALSRSELLPSVGVLDLGDILKPRRLSPSEQERHDKGDHQGRDDDQGI